MDLPRICIQRPVLASMMSLALVLFGIISLTRLPVRELPDVDPPIVSVSTVYPGANPEVVETEITERLEEAINNIEGIKTLTSQSREQSSNITIEFDLSRDIDLAAQDVRDRVSRVRGRLPVDILEPIVAKQDADASPVIWIGVASDRFTPIELTDLAEKQMKNRLQTIGGVSSIFIGGEQRFAIRLWLDAEKMAAYRVTILDVQRALAEQNIELPSGRVENREREMTIQTRGELQTAEEFNRLVLRTEGDSIIRVRDIGYAAEGVENERTAARNRGKPCIFLGVVKQSKANMVQVAQGIKRELELIKPTLPAGIDVDVNYDESVFVEQAINEVWFTLGLAFALVVLVIYVFLHNVRATLIPAISIPVSIVSTFAVLYFLGFSVNILTMLALVLAIGIVVDDTIVVLENISRHIEEGMKPLEAAFAAMNEIKFAVIATTVALVAVFVPLAFQTSATGRLFVEFAVAICAAVVVSTFVALTLSPMLSGRILRPVQKKPGSLVRVFEGTLHWVTDHYVATLRRLVGLSLVARLLVMAVFWTGIAYTSFWLWTHLEGDFLPEEDKGRVFTFLIAPEGSTTEYTDRMVREAEAILEEVPEIKVYGAIIAPGFTGPGSANNAIMFIHLKPREERERSVQEIVRGPGGLLQRFMTELEGAIAIPNIPKAIERRGSSPFQVVVQAQNLEELNRYAAELSDRLRTEGWLANVQTSFEINKPELRLSIDRNRAATLGVSVADISRTLQVLFGGLDMSRLKRDGKEYQVIAQLQRESRLTPQDLDRLYVRNNRGELVQLSNVVNREVGVAPNRIEHYNRLRSATISGTPINMTVGTAMVRGEALIQETLPEGFLYAWSGEARDLNEAGREFWWVLLLAGLITYMVLAGQFESLAHPLTVILSVPLAALGALGSLWLLRALGELNWIPALPAMNINLFSQVGLILLVGLVTKNGILLVEFANQLMNRGRDAHQAILESGRLRLRPILMTAISTIAGILPIAVGFGAGAESRRPMGIVIVGGMITSTFLTLFVIPVIYTVFADVAAWVRRASGSTTASSPTPEPVPVK
jgi:multidrug efflux pump